MDVKQNIMVVAFPVDDFDRNDLTMKTDKELHTLAKNHGLLMWPTVLAFQYALNCDLVDTENNWIYFVDKTQL